jgi:hypothetical protein
MRITALSLSLLIWAFIATSWAGHSVGNGTCDDDILHWSNMIEKRSDAPLYAKSKVMAELAQKAGSVWQCENFMEEALRMIRKTNGEYATE